MVDSKQRFSSRADAYARYRPGYPAAVADGLRARCGLPDGTAAADIGSGTGTFTRCLLAAGFRVSAVEPNAAMRLCAESNLGSDPRFRSVDGSAETTGLGAGSVDLVTAAQAFHWFDQTQAGIEWRRILRPRGWIALIWNERDKRCSGFGRDYQALLLEYATDPRLVDRDHDQPRRIDRLFEPGGCDRVAYGHRQLLDLDGLRGRLLSSSYAPEAGHPRHAPMMQDLERLYWRHQRDHRVSFEYETRVYFGQLG
jgi:SAM-dependent methyltransferase